MSALLTDFLTRYQRLFVLTGAGVSTASGIPEYRDDAGQWKHQQPMEYREFIDAHVARQRYWSRSYVGWQRFSRARPNAAHQALAGLEQAGHLHRLVTQNVDGLHQRAGSRAVTELHGSLASVACLDCGAVQSRARMQQRLQAANPALAKLSAATAPDGDARLQDFTHQHLQVPNCEICGGVLKPEVVFFGEAVPADRVSNSFTALRQADAMLVVGSSLMVYSGFRFVREAAALGLPIVALNRGKTRADELLQAKIETDCGEALQAALGSLSG